MSCQLRRHNAQMQVKCGSCMMCTSRDYNTSSLPDLQRACESHARILLAAAVHLRKAVVLFTSCGGRVWARAVVGPCAVAHTCRLSYLPHKPYIYMSTWLDVARVGLTRDM